MIGSCEEGKCVLRCTELEEKYKELNNTITRTLLDIEERTERIKQNKPVLLTPVDMK